MITVIAEAGVNHNGDPQLAKDLIDAAAGTGATKTCRDASLRIRGKFRRFSQVVIRLALLVITVLTTAACATEASNQPDLECPSGGFHDSAGRLLDPQPETCPDR